MLTFSTISGFQRQVVISLCLYIGQLINGYSSAWSGPVIPKLRDLDQSPIPYLLTEAQLSLMATMIYLGGILGPYVILWLSNIKGRKPCLILAGTVSAISYIVLATTRNVAMLLIGRFFLGFAGGAINVMNLLYIGEIASPSIRGILLTTVGVFMTVGSILLFAIGPYVSYHVTTYIPLCLCAVYLICCLMFIPESPIFYVLQGKDEELKRVLQDLNRFDDYDKMLQLKKDLTADTSVNTKKEWKELFTTRSNRKALFIVVVINVLQHCSGILAVIFFSAAIFDMAGSSIPASIAMIIVGCFQLTGSTVTPFFIESAGRKKILIISSAVCSISMFLLGLYFYLNNIGSPVINHVKWLPMVILICFYVGYDSGLGIIPNAIIGEMFTANVRSKGSTVAMTTSYVAGFAVTTAFGAVLEVVGGHAAFWFFACTCACAVLFTIFFVPETKGKTLIEIQEAL